jgi:glutamate/tyrosine decarboxylase-like PLP-dependent enzyme
LRSNQGKKTLWVKIGIGILLLGFLIAGYVTFEFRNDDAYQTAIEYLKTNSQLRGEIGNIQGFSLFPSGSVTTVSFNGSESGDATFTLTVRGDKKYKDVTVNLKKTPDLFWTVSSVE